MEALIWVGAAIVLLGVGGLFACILAVLRARRDSQDDIALRARLRQIVVYNLGALFVSAIGLMLVIVGILLR